MSIDASRLARGENSSDGEITKTALASDRALIVFSVISFDPNAETHFGFSPDATVDLLVVSGRFAGRRDRQWRVFGNLARQLGEQPAGETTVGRVTSGPGKVAGSSWYGIDFDVSDAEMEAAKAAILTATHPEQVQREPYRLDQLQQPF